MTAPLAALLAAAWTLIVLLGLVSHLGIWRMDRQREGVTSADHVREGEAQRGPALAAPSGRRSETPGAYDPSQIRVGGPRHDAAPPAVTRAGRVESRTRGIVA